MTGGLIRNERESSKILWLILCLVILTGLFGQIVVASSSLPSTIRVKRVSLGRVDTVDFKLYTKRVLPNEWIASWPDESLKSGAMAVKTYAWYWINQGGKYPDADVRDDTWDQVYKETTNSRTNNAVEATWLTGMRRDGQIFQAQYWDGRGKVDTGGSNLRIHDNPGTGSTIVGHVSDGDSICILSNGMTQKNGYHWFFIMGTSCDNLNYDYSGYIKGWVAGEYVGSYWTGENIVNFAGRMTQWGSKYWAEQGKDFRWILRYFYPNIEFFDITSGQPSPVITSSLQLTQSSPYYVGDSLTAQFTIKNRGEAPITFDVLTAGGRFNGSTLPGGGYPDFTWKRDITLNPDGSYSYQGYLTLTKAGDYHFFCAFRTPDGNWNPAIATESGVTNVLDIVVYSQPECYSNSDCGTDGWTGNPFCSSNDIYQYWRTWTCNNPGQPNAYCSYADASTLKQDCGGNSCGSWANYCESGDVYEERTCHDRGCSNGACYDNSYNEKQFIQDCGTSGYTGNDYCYDNDVYRDYINRNCYAGSCFANTEKMKQQDCGDDYYDAWGTNYCKNGDVWHSRTFYDKGCSGGVCYDNSYAEEELVETCQYGCENGKCKMGIEGDINGDCVVDIFDLAAVGLAYGSRPGDGNWNARADLTGDGVVDIFDLATVGLNYGSSC